MGSTKSSVQNEWSVWSDEHGHSPSTSCRPCISGRVDGDVGAHGHCVTAIPIGRLDPGDAVEEGSCAAVAGVSRVDALYVCVAAAFKQLHQKMIKLGYNSTNVLFGDPNN